MTIRIIGQVTTDKINNLFWAGSGDVFAIQEDESGMEQSVSFFYVTIENTSKNEIIKDP